MENEYSETVFSTDILLTKHDIDTMMLVHTNNNGHSILYQKGLTHFPFMFILA